MKLVIKYKFLNVIEGKVSTSFRDRTLSLLLFVVMDPRLCVISCFGWCINLEGGSILPYFNSRVPPQTADSVVPSM